MPSKGSLRERECRSQRRDRRSRCDSDLGGGGRAVSAAARASRAPSQGARVSPELPERAGPADTATSARRVRLGACDPELCRGVHAGRRRPLRTCSLANGLGWGRWPLWRPHEARAARVLVRGLRRALKSLSHFLPLFKVMTFHVSVGGNCLPSPAFSFQGLLKARSHPGPGGALTRRGQNEQR